LDFDGATAAGGADERRVHPIKTFQKKPREVVSAALPYMQAAASMNAASTSAESKFGARSCR
jgi:hypothetical protein